MRSIQNEYIRNADITSIWDNIRIAYMSELYAIVKINVAKSNKGRRK